MPNGGGWHTRHWMEERRRRWRPGATLSRMAAIVLAFCASGAPATAVAGEPAPLRDRARERGVQACVVLSGDLVTSVRQEILPQICVGVPTGRLRVPGHPALAEHLTRVTLAAGFDSATVARDLDPVI